MKQQKNVQQLSQPLPQSMEVVSAVVAQRCYEDEEFRQKLMRDPQGALEEFMGRKLPDTLEVEVRENTPSTWHIPVSSDTFSDEELEQISAGEVVATLFIGTVAVTSIAVGVGITGALWGSGAVPLPV